MVFIVIQFGLTLSLLFYTSSYLIDGILDYIHSKIKKEAVYIIGGFLMLALFVFFGVMAAFSNKNNYLLWYVLTVLTVVFSSLILINNHPVTNSTNFSNCKKKYFELRGLKDYINNSKMKLHQEKTYKTISKFKYAIYPIYILLTLLNQVNSIVDYSFPTDIAFYLQVNEYSLIILFAINETIKFFKTEKGKQNEI